MPIICTTTCIQYCLIYIICKSSMFTNFPSADYLYALYIIHGSSTCSRTTSWSGASGLVYRQIDIIVYTHPWGIFILGIIFLGVARYLIWNINLNYWSTEFEWRHIHLTFGHLTKRKLKQFDHHIMIVNKREP